LKRKAIAEKLPNPKKLDIEKLELAVPLIRSDYGSQKIVGDGVYVREAQYHNEMRPAKKGECEFVEKALYVETEKAGTTTLICRSASCKVHKLKKESSNSPARSASMVNDNLKRKEDDFNSAVAEVVRIPVLTGYIKSFNAEKKVFDSKETIKQLLVAILDGCGYEFEDRCSAMMPVLPKQIKELLSTYGERQERIRAAVDKLTQDEISLTFAFVAFAGLGYTDYGQADQEPVKKIAEAHGIDYRLADAKARVEVAAEEDPAKKPILEKYLEQVISGDLAAKPPTLYWPKPKEKTATKKTSKQKIAVHPDRLEDNGDIAKSLCLSDKGLISKPPFTHLGEQYVSIGAVGTGTGRGWSEMWAYKITPEAEFTGKILTGNESSESRRNNPNGYYHGAKYRTGGKAYILTGPEMTFVREGAAKAKGAGS
jgi:hypothetical protein